MLFRKYFDGTKKQYGSGSNRNLGGSQLSTPMDKLSPNGKAIVVSGKWKRLNDNNSSTKHIVQETTVRIETESLNDEDKHDQMV